MLGQQVVGQVILLNQKVHPVLFWGGDYVVIGAIFLRNFFCEFCLVILFVRKSHAKGINRFAAGVNSKMDYKTTVYPAT